MSPNVGISGEAKTKRRESRSSDNSLLVLNFTIFLPFSLPYQNKSSPVMLAHAHSLSSQALVFF